ncbi:MAG: hypothetical protein HY904_12190 [Deltaproteobacteria bacterium]|nr:hypothetical protein [Deltaproteobacteria bacterium]
MAVPPEHAFLAEFADSANFGGLFSVSKAVACAEQPTSDPSCVWIGERVNIEPVEVYFGVPSTSTYHPAGDFYRALRMYTGSEDVRVYFVLTASPISLDASVPGTVCGVSTDGIISRQNDAPPWVLSPNGQMAVDSSCITSQARNIGDGGVNEEGRTLRELVEGNPWCTLPVSVVEGDLSASAARVPTRGGLDPSGGFCR